MDPFNIGRNQSLYEIAVAGNRAAAGIVIAEIDLKLIWDVIAAIKIGDTGHALAVDEHGRLIAHPTSVWSCAGMPRQATSID
jgi:hypothetical protein